MRQRLAIVILSAVVLTNAAPSGRAQGCAMCRTALENSPEGKALAGSFNYGILFLMGIPYAMFGAAGFVIFRAYRRRAKAEAAATDRR